MSVLNHSQLEQLWVLAGGSQATADTAAAIAQAESGGNTASIDNTAYPSLPGYHTPASGNLPEYSVGLWQINELAHPTYTTAQLLTPLPNASAAVAISGGGRSFGAWSTYTSGAYKQYLQGGGTPAPQPGTVGDYTVTNTAPSAHRGYADLRNSVARHVPTQLQRSTHLGVVTLQVLRAKTKVRGR